MIAHWPEYAIEAVLLGLFMVSACIAVFCLEHPASPLRRIASAALRRAIIGILMGATAVGLIYSPWGRRSGAHMNPGVTLAFLALGKVEPWDALFYILSQFIGGWVGVQAAAAILRSAIRHRTVNYVVTEPGGRGDRVAWIAEFVIAFALMLVVLTTANRPSLAPYTGVFAGVLVALYIAFESPLSGMSINPARTFASAASAGSFRGLWIYFTSPPLAMLAAAGVFTLASGHARCAKLCHDHEGRCIFRCEYGATP
jgi:aquaporin Z